MGPCAGFGSAPDWNAVVKAGPGTVAGMEPRRFVPSVGVVAAVAVVVLLSVPYGVIESPGAVAAYYGGGAVNPLIAGLFALAAVIVFAAARQGRTDPALAAGTALVLGVFGAAILGLWALTVPLGVVTPFETSPLFEYHRFLTAAVALALPAAAAWYARVIGVL